MPVNEEIWAINIQAISGSKMDDVSYAHMNDDGLETVYTLMKQSGSFSSDSTSSDHETVLEAPAADLPRITKVDTVWAPTRTPLLMDDVSYQ